MIQKGPYADNIEFCYETSPGNFEQQISFPLDSSSSKRTGEKPELKIYFRDAPVLAFSLEEKSFARAENDPAGGVGGTVKKSVHAGKRRGKINRRTLALTAEDENFSNYKPGRSSFLSRPVSDILRALVRYIEGCSGDRTSKIMLLPPPPFVAFRAGRELCLEWRQRS